MEILIALVLLIIMYMFETNQISHFVNRTSHQNIFDSNSTPHNQLPSSMKCNSIVNTFSNTNQNKQVIWIFNDYDVSSRHWQHFYSRKNRQPTPAILDICIQTIRIHSPNHFIRVFDQNHIHKLLPEYEPLIKKCTSFYFAYNFIKYAILYKYGGIWIPSDTLMLRPIIHTDNLNSNKIVTFGYNNMLSTDNKGYSDIILGAHPNNPIIGKMITYLKSRIHSFQNGIFFHKSVNKYFNRLLKTSPSSHFHTNQMVVHKKDNTYFNTDNLFSSNIPNIDDFCSKTLVHLNMYHINNLPRHNYILRMSNNQILQSKLFIATLIRYAYLQAK